MKLILDSVGKSDYDINNHLDKYHYILHKLVEIRVFNKSLAPSDFVPLHMKTLEKFLGVRYACQVKNELLSWGIIETDNQYIPGTKSMGYRIAAAHASKAVLRYVHKESWEAKLNLFEGRNQGKSVTERNLRRVGIHALEAMQYIDGKLQATKQFLSSYKHTLVSWKAVADIDAVEFKRIQEEAEGRAVAEGEEKVYSLMSIQTVNKRLQSKHNQGITVYDLLTNNLFHQHDADLVAITKIAKKKFFVRKPDPLSRDFTNITNLSTDLRQFLYHVNSNQHLVNLDIRNSQPYIFSLLLMDEYANHRYVPADVQRYINLCADGELYEYMMNFLGVAEKMRQGFKQRFFAQLFFCTNYFAARTPAGKLFKKLFPNVYSLIHRYKSGKEKGAHKKLAIMMQRREAQVILNQIGRQLDKQKIWYVTIHDSVVVLEEHAVMVKNIIHNTFLKAVGVMPSVKEEVLVNGKKCSRMEDYAFEELFSEPEGHKAPTWSDGLDFVLDIEKRAATAAAASGMYDDFALLEDYASAKVDDFFAG